MPYEVQADEALGLVVVTVTGAFEAKDVAGMVARGRQASAARGWHILYDMARAVPTGVAPGDLYWMPRQHPELGKALAARVRVGLVHPPAFAALAATWETFFRNAGLQAQAFLDRDAAVAWLLRSGP